MSFLSAFFYKRYKVLEKILNFFNFKNKRKCSGNGLCEAFKGQNAAFNRYTFFSFGLRVSESIDLINGLIQLEPWASRPFQPIVDLG